MFCPTCGAEYRPGFAQCHDCGVPLVDEPPAIGTRDQAPSDQTERPQALVTVFQGGDPLTLALAKVILESEGIPFVTQGEGVQDLIGLGRFPGRWNIAAGPVKIHVDARDADRAREVLAEIGGP